MADFSAVAGLVGGCAVCLGCVTAGFEIGAIAGVGAGFAVGGAITGELSPNMSTVAARVGGGCVGGGVGLAPPADGGRAEGGGAERFTSTLASESAALTLSVLLSAPPEGVCVAAFASPFDGGGVPDGGARAGFGGAEPAPGGVPDGGLAAPRILATEALVAGPFGGGPLGGGSADLARNAAAADAVP